MDMTKEERKIYKGLKARPGYFHVSSDHKHIYLLVDGGMLVLTHVDTFEGMDDDALNEYIQDSLKQLA